MKTIIAISGPSGAGKSTLERTLTSQPGFKKVVSFTTREPRVGEQEGVDYFFVTKEKYEQWKRNDMIVQETCFNGEVYGTTLREYACEECSVVVMVPESVVQLESLAALPDTRVFKVFVSHTAETLVSRMLSRRVEDPEYMAKRIMSTLNYELPVWTQLTQDWDLVCDPFNPGDEDNLVRLIIGRIVRLNRKHCLRQGERCYSVEGSVFSDTMEQALSGYEEGESEQMYVGTKVIPRYTEFMNIDRFIEHMQDEAGDEYPGHSEGFLEEVSCTDLANLIEQWMLSRFGPIDFYNVTSIEKITFEADNE